MYHLILGENASKRNKAIVWDHECEEAFRKVKEIYTSTPILTYANFLKPLKSHTDACTLGLGAILYQNQDGVGCVIGYTSRSLNKNEHKYLTYKLEYLALKWAIMEQLHEYLYGNTVVIYMDNNPLTYILTSAQLHATGHC